MSDITTYENRIEYLTQQLAFAEKQGIVQAGAQVNLQQELDEVFAELRRLRSRNVELKQERDEAREAAKELWDEWTDDYMKDGDGGEFLSKHPWLEEGD